MTEPNKRATVYPLENYSEARIREFDETNRIPDALEKRVRERIADKRIGGDYTMEREQLF